MIYSTSDVARQAQPSLQSAVSQLHQANQRVRAGLKLDSPPAGGSSDRPAATGSFGRAPGQNVEPAVKAMVKPELSAQSAKELAASIGRDHGAQFLSIANARPQTVSVISN